MRVFYFVSLTQKFIQKLTLLLHFKRGCYHVIFLTRLLTRGCRRAHGEQNARRDQGNCSQRTRQKKKEAAGEIKDQFYLCFHSTVLVKIVDKAFFNKEQFLHFHLMDISYHISLFICKNFAGSQLASQLSLNIINYVQLQLKKSGVSKGVMFKKNSFGISIG